MARRARAVPGPRRVATRVYEIVVASLDAPPPWPIQASVSDAIARAVFGLMFETSTEALFIIDNAHGRIVSANVRVAELLAMDVGQVVGRTFDQIAFEPRDVSFDGR